MRYFLCCLCASIGLLHRGQAQAPMPFTWQQTYGTPLSENQGYAVVQNGGYLLAGHKEVLGARTAPFYFVQTNAQGDTLWTRQVRPPNNLAAVITGFVRNQGGTLLLTGLDYAHNTGFAMGLTANCVPLWSTTRQLFSHQVVFPTDSLTYIQNPLVAADDNFLVLVRESSFSIITQTENTDDTLVKLNQTTGAQMWAARLDSIVSDSSRLFTWERTATGLLAVIAGIDPITHLLGVGRLKLDAAGNVRSFRTSHQSIGSYGIFAASRDAAGNILIAGRQRLTKLNPQGDTLWHTYAPFQFGLGWDGIAVQEDMQSNYVLLGKSSSVFNDQVHLARFRAATGQLVNDTTLGRSSPTHARSLLRAANGEMVVSGYAENGPHGSDDLFLFQYRGFRPLARHAEAATSSGFRVYPNPAGAGVERVTVALPALTGAGWLTVFDVLGRVVGQQPVPAAAREVAMPVSELPAGLYVLRLVAANGCAWTTKLQRE